VIRLLAGTKSIIILISVKVSQVVGALHATTNELHEDLHALQIQDKTKRILKWLSAPDPSTNYNKAFEQRHEGTGLWFIHGDKFKTWTEQSNSVLWLYGIPGCGKTVLASLVIHHLEQDSPPGSVLLYFFFDFDDLKKQDINNMIRSMICQLYQQEKCARQDLDDMFLTCQSGSQQPTLDSLKKVLNSMLGRTQNVIIVVDALDESCTKSNLLAWIRSILTVKPTTIRLVITSRREQDIESTLETLMDSDSMVNLQNDLVDGDIRSYVRAYVQRSDGFARWQDDQSILGMIETTLSQKAHGM
jgi:Cdc6-like AAA superfamily ATPase